MITHYIIGSELQLSVPAAGSNPRGWQMYIWRYGGLNIYIHLCGNKNSYKQYMKYKTDFGQIIVGRDNYNYAKAFSLIYRKHNIT